MNKKLETRNIFIDTQAFRQQHFKFDNRVLSRLRELGGAGLINIIISDVVRHEVSSQISKKVSEAISLKDKLLNELSFLENDIPKQLAESLKSSTIEDLKNIGDMRWKDYIKNANITVLNSNDICNEELLSLYFEGTFPFSAGKKKNEFPDAISLLSLKAWTKKRNNKKKKVYIISNDSDLKGFCDDDKYISIDELAEFLDIYNRIEERLTATVNGYISNEIEWIIEKIKESFLECEFECSGNWEIEVDDVEIESVDIADINIIKVEDKRAIVSLKTTIEFSANFSGPDYDNSVWDGEDKVYIFLETFSEDMHFDEIFDVSMIVDFDEEAGELTAIEDIQFDGDTSVTLHYDYDDGYPHK
jgi:hypothetical protein